MGWFTISHDGDFSLDRFNLEPSGNQVANGKYIGKTRWHPVLKPAAHLKPSLLRPALPKQHRDPLAGNGFTNGIARWFLAKNDT
jgi:hypothetical protein